MESSQPDATEVRAEPASAREGKPSTVPPFYRSTKVYLFAIAILLVIGFPFWGPLVMRHMSFFRVRRVEILGAHYVAPRDILGRLHVDTLVSVWEPTEPLAARVAKLPEVQTATVRRKLPGTLVVEITERVPVALVPASNGFRVYDERGTALPIDPASVGVDAPILTQRDTAALRLLGEIRARMPALYARVSEVRRTGRDELLLQLGAWPVRVMLDVTMDRLSEIDPVEEDLRRKQLRVAEIDLRYRDQVIARLQ